MTSYVSTKFVEAEAEDRDGIRGMAIIYQDGYRSWCPAEVFQRDYSSTSAMSFGAAIAAMERGHKVSRAGWNGKGMWICKGEGNKALPAKSFWNKHTREFAEENADHVAEVLPYVLMKTADGKIVMGWLASQTDIFATDWGIV